ncbi:unnamed protein product [Withania somnifera]
MGKNGGGSWLGLMKKAFRSPVKENDRMTSSRRREEAEHEEEDQKKRGKRRWIFRKPTVHETTLIHHNQEAVATANDASSSSGGAIFDKGWSDLKQKRAIAVAMTTTVATEAAAVTTGRAREQEQANEEIIWLMRPSVLVKQQRAILIIQSALRGYLARKALGALKGVVKLQALIRGHNVRKQVKVTLQCMQSLVRVQTQVCDQRRRLSCEGFSCGSMFREPKNILELHLSDKESISRNQAGTGDNGYDHLLALEKVEALLQKAKEEAAEKRDNSLAHAFSRKMWTLKKDEDSSSTKDLDEDLRVFHRTNNAKNCKAVSRSSCDQPRDCIKNIEIDTAGSYNSDTDAEFWRLHHQYYQEQQQKFYSYAVPSPLSHRENINRMPMTPAFKMNNILVHSASPRCRREERSHHRMTLLSHRSNINGLISRNSANSCPAADDQPNYMAATASARARERPQSVPRQMPMTPEREITSAAKKRLSFPVQ